MYKLSEKVVAARRRCPAPVPMTTETLEIGPVVDHILIEPPPYRDPIVELHATNDQSTR